MTNPPFSPGAARAWFLRRRPGTPWVARVLGLSLSLSAWAEPPQALKPGSHAPGAVCRTGYLELETTRGMEAVRTAAQQASTREDEAALGFLSERLTELLGKDSSAALRVVAWAETSPEPELSLYLRAVASMQDEVDRWLTLLASHPQTWELLDKDRRATEARARR